MSTSTHPGTMNRTSTAARVQDLRWHAMMLTAGLEDLTSTDLDGDDVALDADTLRRLVEARATLAAFLR